MKLFTNFNLSNYNGYRVHAVCGKAWFPETEEDFIGIYRENPNTRKIILGNGNNIILSKEYYEEEFIILNGC